MNFKTILTHSNAVFCTNLRIRNFRINHTILRICDFRTGTPKEICGFAIAEWYQELRICRVQKSLLAHLCSLCMRTNAKIPFRNFLFWFSRRLYVRPYILSLLDNKEVNNNYNFTWQEYRSYFWWKSEYRVISDPREYTAQVSFTRLKTKSERSNKAGLFIPLDLRTSRLQGKILTVVNHFGFYDLFIL